MCALKMHVSLLYTAVIVVEHKHRPLEVERFFLAEGKIMKMERKKED